MCGRVCILAFCLLASVCVSGLAIGTKLGTGLEWLARDSKLKTLWQDKDKLVHIEMGDAVKQVSEIRAKRQAGSNPPTKHGDFQFDEDGNTYAQIYYSGDNSSVIIVLTYAINQQRNQFMNSNLYRSTNYGASFESLDTRLDGSEGGPLLWPFFHVGNTDKNLIVFQHVSQNRIYYSRDEGNTWNIRTFSINTIAAWTMLWNSVHDEWALAHDYINDVLYITRDLGATWTLLSQNVDAPFDYQWGNPAIYSDTSVFYNTYDPSDKQRANFTVGLYVQTYPYNNQKEVDPKLGRHDDFLMVGPYIFVQKTDNGNVGLYLSYKKAPFKKAKIPDDDGHLNYLVAHINELQALVIVQHESSLFNLYLSDEEGVLFSLSLPDIVIEDSGLDLELIRGVNGTLVANQYVRSGPTQPTDVKRTLITLDNGGNWELVLPPDRYNNGTTVNCDPPQCSLHFHMDSSDYARLSVFSVDSAPGIILAHGSLGSQLAVNPDLFLSRDGGVTWEHTLVGSWGVAVADHGGLMVAAKDLHQIQSSELMYSCSEGESWTGYTFSDLPMTVFGVITEPGEYTTTVSLYGVKPNAAVWDVVTVNFSSIYQSLCTSADFYDWQPWDERTDTDCILGADVTIERRRPDHCCLVGTGYIRTVSFTLCDCTDEDYDCDYGFMHSDGFVGPCIRDQSVYLDDPCKIGKVVAYNKSTGYRKIPGDVCVNGVESTFKPQLFSCCNTGTGQPITSSSSQPPVTSGLTVSVVPAAALGVLFALAVVVAVVLGVVAVVFAVKHSKLRRRYFRLATSGDNMGGTISFTNDSDDREPLQPGKMDDDEEEDDEPLRL